MYDQAASAKYITTTNELLKSQKVRAVEDLRDTLRYHEYLYYVEHKPEISDFEFDTLYKLLEAYEAQHPETITADSPTQRVGSSLNSDFPKRSHLVPMLSLSNSYNAEDLNDWDKRNKEKADGAQLEYCIEPKFDGASISLLYENNLLAAATTRGDGEVGDEITTNAKQIRSIPLSAQFGSYGIQQVEIRGEVMMSKKSFEAYNKVLEEEGAATLANPRNAAAGSLRMKDSKAVAKRNLEAFLYNLSFVGEPGDNVKNENLLHLPETHYGMLEMLHKLGFKIAMAETKVCSSIQDVIDYIKLFEEKRDTLPYEIDGMVIKVNDLQLQDTLGMTSHHPRWAMAYKFKARQATSKLLDVEYQVGRTGAVTPVAKIKAVQVGGVTVTSISIHNEEYIREKDLRIGDTIIIERSGDVIPQIVHNIPADRTGTEKEIIFPATCPVCDDPLYKPEGEAVWRCVNINCKAQVVERIIHFVSKDAMDVKHFGEANIRKFFNQGLISDIPSVFLLKADKLQGLEGFGEKSVTNLLAAIETCKSQPLHRLIYGLGIRYVGENTAKTLAQKITHILDLQKLDPKQLTAIDDVGVKVSASIADFFSNEDNIAMLNHLGQLGISLEKKQEENTGEGRFTGKTFLFTGALSLYKRKDAEELVEKEGAKILSGVSSKLSYLVVGADAGSKLEKAKKLASVTILSEEEFSKLMLQ